MINLLPDFSLEFLKSFVNHFCAKVDLFGRDKHVSGENTKNPPEGFLVMNQHYHAIVFRGPDVLSRYRYEGTKFLSRRSLKKSALPERVYHNTVSYGTEDWPWILQAQIIDYDTHEVRNVDGAVHFNCTYLVTFLKFIGVRKSVCGLIFMIAEP